MRKILTGDPDWPIELVYDPIWLDAGVYIHRNRINKWCLDHNIDFIQTQFGKRFTWSLHNEEVATMILLRWT